MKVLVFLGLAFIFCQAQARVLDVKEQSILAKYMADAFNEMPNNQTKMNALLKKMDAKNVAMAKVTMKHWDQVKKNFEFSSRLSQFVISRKKKILFTIDVEETAPTILLFNGNERVAIDSNDILGSLQKYFQQSQKVGLQKASESLVMQFLLGTQVAAAELEGQHTDAMEGILHLYVAGVSVPDKPAGVADSNVPSTAPEIVEHNIERWQSTYGSFAWARGNGGLESFACGANQASGSVMIGKGKHFFTVTNKDIVIDGTYHLSSRVKSLPASATHCRDEEKVREAADAAYKRTWREPHPDLDASNHKINEFELSICLAHFTNHLDEYESSAKENRDLKSSHHNLHKSGAANSPEDSSILVREVLIDGKHCDSTCFAHFTNEVPDPDDVKKTAYSEATNQVTDDFYKSAALANLIYKACSHPELKAALNEVGLELRSAPESKSAPGMR